MLQGCILLRRYDYTSVAILMQILNAILNTKPCDLRKGATVFKIGSGVGCILRHDYTGTRRDCNIRCSKLTFSATTLVGELNASSGF